MDLLSYPFVKTTRKRFNVTIAVLVAYGSNRNFLKGIAAYLRARRNWNVKILKLQEELTVENILAPSADGIITIRPRTSAMYAAMDRSDVPLVIIGTRGEWFRRRKTGYVIIRHNDESIGRHAADYFRSLGNFRSFGFIAAGPDIFWSDERLHGFADRLTALGHRVSVFAPSSSVPSDDDRQNLVEWLKQLPKPAAVLASYDDMAVTALNACRAADIDVPRQMAVLGVDNDEILCDFAEPTLSSIAPNAASAGEAAARALDALMRARRPPPGKTILIEREQVVERDSTAPISPSTHLLENALAYIREQATSGIRTTDVVKHLGISRSLADRIFREQYGETIGATITRARIESVQTMLRNTRLPIRKITAVCGFPAETYAKRVFRKATGQTMSDWRRGATPIP